MCVYTSESLHGPRVRADDRVLFVGCWWARRLSTGDGASSHCTIRVCVVSVCCAVIGELKGRVCFNTQERIKNDGAHHTRNRFVPNKKACLLSFSIHARLVVRIFPTRHTQLRSHTPRHSLAPPQSLGLFNTTTKQLSTDSVYYEEGVIPWTRLLSKAQNPANLGIVSRSSQQMKQLLLKLDEQRLYTGT